MDANQLRAIIEETLREADRKAQTSCFYSPKAVELLMMTAAAETNLGFYIKQIKGPALGIFQMEPATHNDIFENWLVYKSDLFKRAVDSFYNEGMSDELNLMGNLPYQIVMARCHYLRNRAPIPEHWMLGELAKYYKHVWNTHLGDATPEKALRAYLKYAS